MHSISVMPRFSWPVAATVAALVAFVLAPRPLAAIGGSRGFVDQADLADTFRTAFAGYWNSGRPAFTPELAEIADYWVRYHLVKAVFATIVLVAALVIGMRLRRTELGAGSLTAAYVAVSSLTVVAAAAVLANVQGAVSPFASLLSMLPTDRADAALDQVQQGLENPAPHGMPAVLDAMVDDFARFHAVMVVIGAVTVLVLVGASALLWQWRARTDHDDRRNRTVATSFAVFVSVMAVGMLVVVAANLSTVADPAPALLAVFA